MRVLIADDEAALRQWLRRLLLQLEPGLEIVAETADVPATRTALAALRPDVAFLDIRMPGGSGLDLAAALPAGCRAVFVTAYEEFAVQAFEQAALDYLVKPVSAERLQRTLARLGASSPTPAGELAQLRSVLQQLLPAGGETPRPLRWLTLGLGDSVRLLDVQQVDYFEACDKYTQVHAGSEGGLMRLPLSKLETQLDPEQFWRIQRSLIVRTGAIREIRRDLMGRLQLFLQHHPDTLPVSRAYAGRFRAM
ncbi:MAG: hypothetical protein RIR00_890 [Pseudomonadota bacterium]